MRLGNLREGPSTGRPAGRAGRLVSLVAELARFGTVGAVAFVVNWSLFNLLVFGPGQLLGPHPTRARILASCVATVVAWLGNRYWTFRRQRQAQPLKEFIAFALVNLGGIAIEAVVQFVAAWPMGYHGSKLAMNLAFLIGTALGTLFRYLMYKFTVFTQQPTAGETR